MVDISSYDITTHERYARDQEQIVQSFQKQYHVPPSGARKIALQTQILDFVPKPSALALLLQTGQRKLWARFTVPTDFYTQRVSSAYTAPSLGSSEKQEADIQRIESYLKMLDRQAGLPQETKEALHTEGAYLASMLRRGVMETNEMVDYVISRMKQFLQA